jgi:hypothetical protein
MFAHLGFFCVISCFYDESILTIKRDWTTRYVFVCLLVMRSAKKKTLQINARAEMVTLAIRMASSANRSRAARGELTCSAPHCELCPACLQASGKQGLQDILNMHAKVTACQCKRDRPAATENLLQNPEPPLIISTNAHFCSLFQARHTLLFAHARSCRVRLLDPSQSASRLSLRICHVRRVDVLAGSRVESDC